jgi:hypothetical protein
MYVCCNELYNYNLSRSSEKQIRKMFLEKGQHLKFKIKESETVYLNTRAISFKDKQVRSQET